jgi:hypothetical protein
MTILQSVDRLIEVLERSKCQYVIIGGVAILLHGGRASTIDFDLYVLADDMMRLKTSLLNEGATCDLDAEHQLRFKFNKVFIDVLEADKVLRECIFKRASRMKINKAIANVASPEDLIILKTMADRPIDRRDVAELREIFSDNLDETYIEQTIKKLKA